MVDQVLSQEKQELEALVTMLQDHPNQGSSELNEPATYGSDEESYESIFLELLKNDTKDDISQNGAQRNSRYDDAKSDNEAMDTTG